MLTIIVFLITSVTILIVLLLVIVVIGIRHEPTTEELSEQPPSLISAFVRRFLGLYVRKPDLPSHLDRGDGTSCLVRVVPIAIPMHKPNRDER